MTKSGTILFVAVHSLLTGICAQDPVSSHFYANSLQLNPSLAGIEGPSKVYIGYRNQWPNSGSAYITYQASYDQYVEKLHGGLGVNVFNDMQGDGVFNTYNLNVMYAYHFQATRRLFFSGGMQAGVGQRSFDPSSLVFGDMIDPVSGGISPGLTELIGYSKFYPDFSTGISAFSGIFYGGIAMHHIFSPVFTDKSDPEGTIPRKYTGHIGAMIPIYEKRSGREIMQLSPGLVAIRQQSVHQINYGLDLLYRNFFGGVWTRHDLVFNYGNIIFTAGYVSGNLRFRYSYDIKLLSPTIRLKNMGAHEFSLLIINYKSDRRKNRRAIKIPKI
ncbi:MAG: PorP/SprF family type IX secretion system membrane protein [Bacteroidales bacterium]